MRTVCACTFESPESISYKEKYIFAFLIQILIRAYKLAKSDV